jgi:hypothetical protein
MHHLLINNRIHKSISLAIVIHDYILPYLQTQLLKAAKSGLADNILAALAEGAEIEFASEVRHSYFHLNSLNSIPNFFFF